MKKTKFWLNLGDSYAGSGKNRNAEGKDYGIKAEYKDAYHQGRRTGIIKKTPLSGYLKPKDLIGVPWRVAFALQTDGWYLRQDIIWQKSNVMPEAVTDRCVRSHEYIFLLSKKRNYYFDYESIKEKSVTYENSFCAGQTEINTKYNFRRADTRDALKQKNPQKRINRKNSAYDITMRNKRDVWTVPTRPYKGAHFAVFPPALIQPCILAGSRIRNKEKDEICLVTGVTNSDFGIIVYLAGYYGINSTKLIHERFSFFDDGSPCGELVE